DGQVATLGRGGSDLTATLLARVLGAREVSLWKDVPGLLTADPRIVPDARVVPQVHLREAAELAYYGAKVLHPRSLVPVMKQNVAIRIRPFAEPASLGTEISRRRTLEQYPVKALSAIPKQALLTVTGSGMLGVPGIAARVFSALAEAGINVIATAQGSSELNLSLVVDGKEAPRAQRLVHAAFQLSKIGGGAVAHPERSDVVLLGFGQIGRALAPMIAPSPPTSGSTTRSAPPPRPTAAGCCSRRPWAPACPSSIRTRSSWNRATGCRRSRAARLGRSATCSGSWAAAPRSPRRSRG